MCTTSEAAELHWTMFTAHLRGGHRVRAHKRIVCRPAMVFRATSILVSSRAAATASCTCTSACCVCCFRLRRKYWFILSFPGEPSTIHHRHNMRGPTSSQTNTIPCNRRELTCALSTLMRLTRRLTGAKCYAFDVGKNRESNLLHINLCRIVCLPMQMRLKRSRNYK